MIFIRLNFPLVCLFKRSLLCLLQKEDGLIYESKYRVKARMKYKTWSLLLLFYLVLKTNSNEAEVYFRQIEETAKSLMRVKEHLNFSEIQCLLG